MNETPFPCFATDKYRVDRIGHIRTFRYGGAVRAESPALPLVVFSDADGVLTVPRMPTGAGAAMLEPIVRAHVPVVLCSGQTRAELEMFQQDLGIRGPFISEGGGALFVPRGYFGFDIPDSRPVAGYDAIEFGRPYPEVVEELQRTAGRLKIRIVGFNDLSVEEVAFDCRVPLLRARLAKLREYQELFRFSDTDAGVADRLIRALTMSRLRCERRGSYYCVGGMIDSAVAASALCRLYRRAFGRITTIGLADRFASRDFLRLMDHRVLIDADEPGTANTLVWARTIVEAVSELGALSIDRASAARGN